MSPSTSLWFTKCMEYGVREESTDSSMKIQNRKMEIDEKRKARHISVENWTEYLNAGQTK